MSGVFSWSREPWTDFQADMGFAPRGWQLLAMASIARHWKTSIVDPGAMVRAVMGAGKSILLAEVCRCYPLEDDETIIVTAPSQLLVRQLAKTLALRVGKEHVGKYFADAKEPAQRVVVTCAASALSLAHALESLKRKVALWIADEAHGTETARLLEANVRLAPGRVLGVTATPFRSDASERLTLFGTVVFDYGLADAIADDVLVIPEFCYWVGPDLEIDETCIEMVRGAEGPGIFSANDIQDAEGFAALASDELSFRVEAIHSGLPNRERKRRIRALESGEIWALVHVNLLTEGADFPWLRWLCRRRETASSIRYLQEIGRVLRTYPGKDVALIFDPWRHSEQRSLERGAALWDGDRRYIVLLGLEETEEQRAAARHWLDLKKGSSIREIVIGTAGSHELLVAQLAAGTASRVVAYSNQVITGEAIKAIQDAELPLHFVVQVVETRPEDAPRVGRVERPDYGAAVAESLTRAAAWLGSQAQRLELLGWCKRWRGASWRSDEATRSQLRRARWMMLEAGQFAASIADRERQMLRVACASAARGRLSKGEVSDLMAVLDAVAAAEGWPTRTRRQHETEQRANP